MRSRPVPRTHSNFFRTRSQITILKNEFDQRPHEMDIEEGQTFKKMCAAKEQKSGKSP